MDISERMAAIAKESSNPLKAIRAFCYQCQGGTNPKRGCTTSTCSLYDFRTGTNPRRKARTVSAAKGRELVNRLKMAAATAATESGSQSAKRTPRGGDVQEYGPR